MPQTIIIADSTQLTCADECLVRWYYRYVEKLGKVPIKLNNLAADDEKVKQNTRDMGTIFHRILEFRYKNKQPIIECIQNAFDSCRDEEVTITKDEGELVKKVALYYDAHYAINGDFEVRRPESVEVGFSEVVHEDDQHLFILEGRIDIAEAYMNDIRVSVDHKGQARAHNLYTKCIQFRNYAMVMKTDFFVINYIRFHKYPVKDTFSRVMIPFSSAEHRAWKQELIGIYKRMAHFKEYMERFGEKNEFLNSHKHRSQCLSSYGSLCEYITLCDEPNQNALLNIKNMQYEHKEPFKPW